MLCEYSVALIGKFPLYKGWGLGLALHQFLLCLDYAKSGWRYEEQAGPVQYARDCYASCTSLYVRDVRFRGFLRGIYSSSKSRLDRWMKSRRKERCTLGWRQRWCMFWALFNSVHPEHQGGTGPYINHYMARKAWLKVIPFFFSLSIKMTCGCFPRGLDVGQVFFSFLFIFGSYTSVLCTESKSRSHTLFQIFSKNINLTLF